ncbi:acyltransferase family protein [Actinophytocola glycyrrhizae]|uniref:Acyltransferase family protein n=1 Tax=Actinophytocola glycyrrhizae TaxID=2044873 RepID=A0ABV9S2R2_9PSEU
MTAPDIATENHQRQAVSAGPRRDEFQPEIQGLRAVAVLLVVIYHLWPNRLSGGFIGVDVFFVISGYLITAHLVREVSATGRLSAARFWSRRVRRLLPLAMTVSLISTAAVYLLAPSTVWDVTVRQVVASTLYVQNWVLAGDAIDYSAKDNDATIAQHYWSLSIEEQFYFVWPLLVVAIVAVLALVRARLGRAPELKTVLVYTLVAVGMVSFGCSVVLTAGNQATAYFVTPTRVWEFVFGALISLLPLRALRGPWAMTAGWTAMAVIVVTGYLFSSATAFPGWIAVLPVAATAVALVTLRDRERYSAGYWLTRRPMIFLGDISYGLYLWHWPLIVLAPYVLDGPVPATVKLGLLALGIVLSWVSKLVVEDPLRHSALLRPTRNSLGFAVAGMTAVAVALLVVVPAPGVQAGPAEYVAGDPCHGPGVLDPANNCGSLAGGAPVPPPAVVIRENKQDIAYPGCQADADTADIVSCILGDKNGTRTIAIVGDSHATSWFPAFDRLGRDNSWRILTFTRSSCPFTLAERNDPEERGELGADRRATCDSHVDRVLDKITTDPDIDTVVSASYSSVFTFTARPAANLANPAVDGFIEVWSRLHAAGKSVVVMADVPLTGGKNVPTCLAEKTDPADCAVPRRDALPATRMAQASAVQATNLPNVTLVDLSDQFCDAQNCYAQLGSVIVYRDKSHVSRTFSLALAPYIERAFPAHPR